MTERARFMARQPGFISVSLHRSLLYELSINLHAVPSFEAFGRFLETAGPLAFWAQAVQMAWLPWLEAASALMLPRSVTSAPPKPGTGHSESGTQGRSHA